MARPRSSSRLSCGERLHLRCDGIAGNSFSTTQEKNPSSGTMKRKRAPLDVGGTLVLPLDWKRVCRGTSCVAARVLRTLWKFQRLGVISIETPQGKWASSRLKGRTSWIFSSCGRYCGLKTGTSGTALVASGNASPHANCSGASRDSSPVDAGA